MASNRKDELETAIAGFEKQIASPDISATLKTVLGKALEKAKKELAELPQAPAEKKTDEKKEKKVKAPKKQKPEKKEEKPEKKEKEEAPETMTVDGVVYNMEICEQVLAAAHARKERDGKTSKKSKSKAPVAKAADSVEAAVEKVIDLIPEEEIAETPQRVIDALEKFEADQTKALFDFCKKVGISAALREKLEKAYEASIAPIIKEIEQEIAAKKKKE